MSEKSVNLIKLAGLIAGDGCIDQRGRIIFKHSTIQKEYADYKAEKLFEYFGLKYNKYLCKLLAELNQCLLNSANRIAIYIAFPFYAISILYSIYNRVEIKPNYYTIKKS